MSTPTLVDAATMAAIVTGSAPLRYEFVTHPASSTPAIKCIDCSSIHTLVVVNADPETVAEHNAGHDRVLAEAHSLVHDCPDWRRCPDDPFEA